MYHSITIPKAWKQPVFCRFPALRICGTGGHLGADLGAFIGGQRLENQMTARKGMPRPGPRRNGPGFGAKVPRSGKGPQTVPGSATPPRFATRGGVAAGSQHKKPGPYFRKVPAVLLLRSHSLITLVRYFSDCLLIVMSTSSYLYANC